MNSVEKLIKRLHLLALLPVLGIFFIFLIFFIPDKKLILFLFLILPFPSILYGKHWAKNFSCLLKNKKLINKENLASPFICYFLYHIIFLLNIKLSYQTFAYNEVNYSSRNLVHFLYILCYRLLFPPHNQFGGETSEHIGK